VQRPLGPPKCPQLAAELQLAPGTGHRTAAVAVRTDGAVRGRPVQVKVVVTEVSWDGNIRRSPVYVIHAGDRAVLVGEENLIGSLHELVRTILQTSGPSGSEASQ
jgi:hypothetical protein